MNLKIGILVFGILAVVLVSGCAQSEETTTGSEDGTTGGTETPAIDHKNVVIANESEFLEKYGESELEFKKMGSAGLIVYWHNRTIDDAMVIGDEILYHFDEETKEFVMKRVNWRDDLPENLPSNLITKEEAEAMVEGNIMHTYLAYMPMESNMFQIEPTQNPCWIVSIAGEHGFNVDVIVIDAVEREIVGHGVPVP